jgi:AcrR family transcriptional regulator
MNSAKAESAYLPKPEPRVDTSARDRILAIATRLFYRHGIRSIGVNTVIAEAEVAKTTLYEHFRSKDELIAQCLHRLDERYFRWFVDEVERRAEDPMQRLLAMFEIYDEWFQSADFRGCAFINAAVELADNDHPATAAITHHKRRARALIERLARDAGFADPTAVSEHLTLLMEGAIITALVEGDWKAARRARAATVRLLSLEHASDAAT